VIKTKDELTEDEFDKFDSRTLLSEDDFDNARTIFRAYIQDTDFRNIIDQKNFSQLNVTPWIEPYMKLSQEIRTKIPEYIKDNVQLNIYMD
jgi:hypothetical protein